MVKHSPKVFASEEKVTTTSKLNGMGAAKCVMKSVLDSLLFLMLTFQAAEAVNPQLFTIATLTGHAIRAMGPNYSVSKEFFFFV